MLYREKLPLLHPVRDVIRFDQNHPTGRRVIHFPTKYGGSAVALKIINYSDTVSLFWRYYESDPHLTLAPLTYETVDDTKVDQIEFMMTTPGQEVAIEAQVLRRDQEAMIH